MITRPNHYLTLQLCIPRSDDTPEPTRLFFVGKNNLTDSLTKIECGPWNACINGIPTRCGWKASHKLTKNHNQLVEGSITINKQSTQSKQSTQTHKQNNIDRQTHINLMRHEHGDKINLRIASRFEIGNFKLQLFGAETLMNFLWKMYIKDIQNIPGVFYVPKNRRNNGEKGSWATPRMLRKPTAGATPGVLRQQRLYRRHVPNQHLQLPTFSQLIQHVPRRKCWQTLISKECQESDIIYAFWTGLDDRSKSRHSWSGHRLGNEKRRVMLPSKKITK